MVPLVAVAAVCVLAAPDAAEFRVDKGTRIPLVLLNSVSTKQSQAGDRIYLETAFPIVLNRRIVIPPGSYVAGTLTFVKRPGRMKGRGELFLRFDSLTLPNGVTRDFRARPGQADGDIGGELDREEGKIRSEGSRVEDARSIGNATASGASAGTIAGSVAGRPGLGAATGAAAGAAAGVMGVLLSRGPDLVLARGVTIEMVLDRPIVFTESELSK
jgi:type IV secretion system protein VirB10